jgi:type IV pilus assembly protein PilO
MNYDTFREIIGARPKMFAFLLFLGVLNLLLVLYLALWQRPELTRAQSEWFAKRQELASKPGAGIAATYQRDQRDLAEFRRRYIPKRDFAAFLSKMYETARNNSLKLSSVSYKPVPIPEQGVLSYGISFTASGRYAGLKSFISDVSRYPEMVTLDSVGLSSGSQTQESVVLRLNMTAYLKPEGA